MMLIATLHEGPFDGQQVQLPAEFPDTLVHRLTMTTMEDDEPTGHDYVFTHACWTLGTASYSYQYPDEP